MSWKIGPDIWTRVEAVSLACATFYAGVLAGAAFVAFWPA